MAGTAQRLASAEPLSVISIRLIVFIRSRAIPLFEVHLDVWRLLRLWQLCRSVADETKQQLEGPVAEGSPDFAFDLG